MNTVVANAPPSTTATATAKGIVRETIGKDGQPVREWIDTLLMAAVIAKDKQKQGGSGATDAADGSHPDAAAAELAGGETAEVVENMPSSGSEGKATDAGTTSHDTAASEQNKPSTRGKKDTAKDEDEGNKLRKANGATSEEGAKEDGDGDASAKRYRRRRCEVPGCTKFARFNNACSGHGGRRLCSQTGCTRVAQFGHKCSAHGGIKYCSVEGCVRAVQSRGCCKTHGGGVRCQTPGCAKGAISNGHCRSHGGGSRCAENGCLKWAQRHGFCVRHSKAESASSSPTNEKAS
ncbi:hypothetical protein FI667_g1180, partial [Globisporangium splendens]